MKKKFSLLAGGAVAVAGFAQTIHAQNITESTTAVTAWSGTPVFETGSTPTVGNGGTTNDNDSWGANGTAGEGVNGQGSLGEAFIATASGTLSTAQLVMAGSSGTFNVELYDLGAPQSGFQVATGGSPAQIQQVNTLGTAPAAGSAGTYNGGTNLLTAGDQITFGGTATDTLMLLSFGGTDSNVQLVAGELYMLALDPTNNLTASGIWWQRGGLTAVAGADNQAEGLNEDGVDGVQNFEGKSTVRDFDLAITEVPEPASASVVALGAVGLFTRRRNKTA
jgi:hypothetical protein